jgi:branched-chain amino acid transport system permease protein
MTYSSDVAITVNGFAAAVFGGLGSIRLALIGGYALGILEQLVVGYIDPQYSLIIALIVMLVLIGWRSRAEIASASHEAHAAIQRARVPWPAPVRIALILAGGVFACWLPYQLSSFDVSLYDRMGLYALVTIGLTLLMGYAGQISLGQGAFFLIGAYTSALLTVGLDPAHASSTPTRESRPHCRPRCARCHRRGRCRHRGPCYASTDTSLSQRSLALIASALPFRLGPLHRRRVRHLGDEAAHSVFGRTCEGPCAAVVWAIVAVALLLATNLVHSRVGRALQAIATDETSAAASGIPVPSYKLRLFVFAAALAGLGGGLFTFSFLIVTPGAFPIVLSIEFVVMVAVGGLGNIYGAVAGTIAILYLEQKLRELGARSELYGWDLPAAAPTVFSFGVFGLILIAIMLFFPRGLLPALGDAAAAGRKHIPLGRRERSSTGVEP